MLDFKGDYFGFQEGARRFDAALKGIPDRVPVYAQIHEFAMKELNISASIFYSTPEIIVPGSLEIIERYGLDVAFIDYDVYNIEAEGLGQKIIFSDLHTPDADRSRPLITGPEDLIKIVTPDFNTAGRFPFVIEVQQLFEKFTGLAPALQFCAPFSLAANIRGVENLIRDIFTNPDFARGLFDALVEEVLAPWILYQKKLFPKFNGIVGSDAMASLPIVNLPMLEEWVVPYIQRLREICGQELYVPNWVGESHLQTPEDMLALKLLGSPGLLEGQDPDVEILGPDFYKRYAEEKEVPLVLGIGAAFLAQSNPEDIRKRVKHYIKVGGENGRFALYLCNVGAATLPENLAAAVDTVHSFGKYNN